MREKTSADVVHKYVQLIVVLVSVVIAYQRMRGDLDMAFAELHRVVGVIESQQLSISEMQRKQAIIEQNVSDFRQTYEKDFNRYIREK